jgi:PAS domain S-box-containing protein
MPQHDNDASSPVERDLDARIGAVERRITSTVDMLQMQQAIIENLPDAKVVVDDAGRIVVVNRQTELMFGYTRKEMRDQPLDMLLPERFQEIHRSHCRRFCDDARTRPMGGGLELWARRKSGREFRVDIMLAPIVVAAGSFTIAVIRRLRDEPPASLRALAPERAAACRPALSLSSGDDTPLMTDAHYRRKR